MIESELRKLIRQSFNSEKDMARIFSPQKPLSQQINKQDLARLEAGERCCKEGWIEDGGIAYCIMWPPDCEV